MGAEQGLPTPSPVGTTSGDKFGHHSWGRVLGGNRDWSRVPGEVAKVQWGPWGHDRGGMGSMGISKGCPLGVTKVRLWTSPSGASGCGTKVGLGPQKPEEGPVGELTSPWGELEAPEVFWPRGQSCYLHATWTVVLSQQGLQPDAQEGTGMVVAAGSPAPRGQAAGVPCGLVLSQLQRTLLTQA